MRLSTKGRYAVMAMADLARASSDPGPRGRGVPLGDIAERQGLSLPYLEQLFARLRRAGLVVSHRGPGGGYSLARTAGTTSVGEIVAAVDEPIHATRCEGPGLGCLGGGERCLTHDLWEALERRIEDFLSGVTLEDLVARRLARADAALDIRGEGAPARAPGAAPALEAAGP